jgi:hypothetical protein
MVNTHDIGKGLVLPDDEDLESSSGNGSDSCAEDANTKRAELGKAEAGFDKKEGIAKNETKTVFRLKLTVILVLIVAAVLAAVLIYRYTAGTEESQFKDQFANDASKVLAAAGSSLDRTLGALDSLAVTLVSSARALNQSWPFVTLPDFAVRASKILPLSDAVYISVNPLVTTKTRKDWEAYSLQNNYWVNETMAVQATFKGYYGAKTTYDPLPPDSVINGDTGDIPYNVR